MATEPPSSLPACLLGPFPAVLPPPIPLEGSDLSLATEILPAPPPLSAVQIQPSASKRENIKRPLPSFLPKSDPGSTYGSNNITLTGGLAPSVDDRGRRKRARLDKSLAGRPPRAPTRGQSTPTNPEGQGVASTSTAEPLSRMSSNGVEIQIDQAQQPPYDEMDDNGTDTPVKLEPEDVKTPLVRIGNNGKQKEVNPNGKDKQKKKEGSNSIVEDEPPEGAPAPFPNNDFCSGCNITHAHSSSVCFLYCDGCPRAFHFGCLDPPLSDDTEISNEKEWFCAACSSKKKPPPKVPKNSDPFDLLTYNLQFQNPSVYQLPDEIRAYFKDVAVGPYGVYVDSGELKPGRTTRQGFLEERDPYRLKDRHNSPVLCFKCHQSAAPPSSAFESDEPPPKRRKSLKGKEKDTSDDSLLDPLSTSSGRSIISCDYCNLHWHLDCLNPPLAILPPPHKKWMCPNHAEHVLPKRRVPRHGVKVVDVKRQNMRNNGNIVVIPDPDEEDNGDIVQNCEEIFINNRRYQVPERTIRLDFWTRIGNVGRSRRVSSADFHILHEQRDIHDSPSSSSSSPLTSLSSLEDEIDTAHAHADPRGMSQTTSERSDYMEVSPTPQPEPPHMEQVATDIETAQTSRDLSMSSSTSSDKLSNPAPHHHPLVRSRTKQTYRRSASPSYNTSDQPNISPAIKPGSKSTSFRIRIPPTFHSSPRAESPKPRNDIKPLPRRSLRRQDSSASTQPTEESSTADRSSRATSSKTNGDNASPEPPPLSPEEMKQLQAVRELMRLKGESTVLGFLKS